MHDTLNKYSATLTKWDGETVELEYRLPTLRRITDYCDLLGDAPGLLEFLFDKEEGWADQFTDDSIYELLDKVGEQMDPRIAAWLKRQAAIKDQIQAAKEKLGLPKNIGTGLPQTLPSKPGGALKKSST